MELIKFEEMKSRILGVESFEDIEITENIISVYDSLENRFLEFKNLETLNPMDLFEFNSLRVNEAKFINILNQLDKNMFMLVNKIIFINSKEEADALAVEYESQPFDIENMVGVNFYDDNVIVINAYLLKKSAEEIADYIFSFDEEFSWGLITTLIHELRHNITYNPIITEEEIPLEEGSEEAVESYCIKTFNDIEMNVPVWFCA